MIRGKLKCSDSMIKIVYLLIFSICFLIGCRSSSDMKGESESTRAASSDQWIRYSYSERRGKTLYDHYCSHCHGLGGRGDGANAYTLDPKPRNLADSTFKDAIDDTTLVKRIALGRNAEYLSALMPTYAKTLTIDEITFIGDYICTFTKK